VIIEDCNCTAPATSAGVFSDVLTIADNDGPSLSLQVNPLSLAEGQTDAGVLTVTRNTPTDVDLIVTLSSADETEIVLPATVTIPIGSSSINVPINTIQDDIMDGNQQVTLQANATNFSPGIAYAIVTDVNKPDLGIINVNLPDASVPALQNFQYNYSISNNGLANAPIGANIKVYLSVDLIIDEDDLLISDYCIPQAIMKDDALEIMEFATAPEEAGNYFMILIVNSAQTMTEIQYFNNTSTPVPILIEPDYYGTATVDEDLFLQGEEIIINGTSIDEDGAIVPNVALEVYIINDMFRRELDVTTDENGAFNMALPTLENYDITPVKDDDNTFPRLLRKFPNSSP